MTSFFDFCHPLTRSRSSIREGNGGRVSGQRSVRRATFVCCGARGKEAHVSQLICGVYRGQRTNPCKPRDMTAQDVCRLPSLTPCFSANLSPGFRMGRRSHSRSCRYKIPLEYIQHRRPATLGRPRYNPPSLPSSRDTFAMSQVCRRWRTALISSAMLWTRIDCQSLTRTIAILERHRSMPLHLKLRNGFPIEALNTVLDHGSKFASVSARIAQKQLNPLHQHSVTPSVEDLVLFLIKKMGHQRIAFVANSNHCAGSWPLDPSGCSITLKPQTSSTWRLRSRGPPRNGRSTPFWIYFRDARSCKPSWSTLVTLMRTRKPHTPVTLPDLHSIELGCREILAGLMIPLRFPPAVAVAFRDISPLADPLIQEFIQHVLAVIDIQSVTLARVNHQIGRAHV